MLLSGYPSLLSFEGFELPYVCGNGCSRRLTLPLPSRQDGTGREDTSCVLDRLCSSLLCRRTPFDLDAAHQGSGGPNAHIQHNQKMRRSSRVKSNDYVEVGFFG